jgi:hypothetical protein
MASAEPAAIGPAAASPAVGSPTMAGMSEPRSPRAAGDGSGLSARRGCALALERRINIMVRNEEKRWFSTDEYMRLSTLYIFGEYLGWYASSSGSSASCRSSPPAGAGTSTAV